MSGVDGYGCQLQRSDMGSPATFTTIAAVTNIGGPEIERETYESTAHDTPDAYREYIAGLKDGGEVSIELRYNPNEHDSLLEDLDDTEARDYQLVWPQITGAMWSFKAWLTGFSPEGPHDDLLSAEVTFKVTGKPVIS
ncbi:hypothetical protein Aple_010750 [Acrocarpospora pleiomorpha]|uniref:Lambda phage tail tube protein N-terminal domain-containing protein n=1 Tax=Acrocarpospora pleiomorpha TaxID=90975 RepID=A0A5M3XAL4_9ACTN|nr:phage tail tube protein [Acrocarpospora pleiomorpha]GES18180.1 hypothetical protein Aple_010750 [Acrocarpospora pleiomorpha]